jgi:hypothetical protein
MFHFTNNNTLYSYFINDKEWLQLCSVCTIIQFNWTHQHLLNSAMLLSYNIFVPIYQHLLNSKDWGK